MQIKEKPIEYPQYKCAKFSINQPYLLFTLLLLNNNTIYSYLNSII